MEVCVYCLLSPFPFCHHSSLMVQIQVTITPPPPPPLSRPLLLVGLDHRSPGVGSTHTDALIAEVSAIPQATRQDKQDFP